MLTDCSRFSRAEDQLAHPGRLLLGELGKDVGVGVEGDRDRRVTEAVAHDLRMDARAEGERRVSVAQIVETDRG